MRREKVERQNGVLFYFILFSFTFHVILLRVADLNLSRRIKVKTKVLPVLYRVDIEPISYEEMWENDASTPDLQDKRLYKSLTACTPVKRAVPVRKEASIQNLRKPPLQVPSIDDSSDLYPCSKTSAGSVVKKILPDTPELVPVQRNFVTSFMPIVKDADNSTEDEKTNESLPVVEESGEVSEKSAVILPEKIGSRHAEEEPLRNMAVEGKTQRLAGEDKTVPEKKAADVIEKSEPEMLSVPAPVPAKEIQSFSESSPAENSLKKPIKKVNAEAVACFQAMVSGKINRFKVYPTEARRNNQEGRVTVSFQINPNGILSNLCVTGSSGYDLLDKAAMDAAMAGEPYLPFPEGLNGPVQVSLTVWFKIGAP